MKIGNKNVKILAVDFDGTLTESNEYPNIGQPNLVLLNSLIKAKKNGDIKIILWTCRIGPELDQAVKWCNKMGLELDAINENIIDFKTSNKIYADIYIDDRCINVKDL